MRKRANGKGSVYKLSGRRANPWAVRKTIGYNENGHPIYNFIGFYHTYEEANRVLTEYNKSPYSLNGETLLDMYEKFIVSYENSHKPNTVSNFKSKWKHLEPLYKEPVAKLTRKKLQLFFDNFDASTIVKKKVKIVLKLIMDYSIRYDVIPPEKIVILDYIDLSSQVVNKKINHKTFTNEEIERLEAINDDMARTILFLIYTGLRAGEFCNLTEDDIDQDMVIHVTDSKTESGIRDIPLSKKALKLAPITHYGNYNRLYHRFCSWREKNNFDHELHDTRHTLISLLTEKEVDARIIRSIVGHKGTGVTEEVYTHISIETKREALDKI
jgi:integrase